MAYKNKMDVAFEIAIGSSLQMVLFVTPSAAGFRGTLLIIQHLMHLDFFLHLPNKIIHALVVGSLPVDPAADRTSMKFRSMTPEHALQAGQDFLLWDRP
ncbi:MAG TPA: hypothetical protein VIK44_04940 [Acetobacterium sp.]